MVGRSQQQGASSASRRGSQEPRTGGSVSRWRVGFSLMKPTRWIRHWPIGWLAGCSLPVVRARVLGATATCRGGPTHGTRPARPVDPPPPVRLPHAPPPSSNPPPRTPASSSAAASSRSAGSPAARAASILESASEDPRVLLRRRWELASVLHFLRVFEPVIKGDLALSAEEIETAFISNNHDLARIHIALLKGAKEVALLSHTENKIVAHGRLRCTDKTVAYADGLPLGDFYEILVDVVLDKNILLPRVQGQPTKLGTTVGRCILWPNQNVVQPDGSTLNIPKRGRDYHS